jgi:hypothetical protein
MQFDAYFRPECTECPEQTEVLDGESRRVRAFIEPCMTREPVSSTSAVGKGTFGWVPHGAERITALSIPSHSSREKQHVEWLMPKRTSVSNPRVVVQSRFCSDSCCTSTSSIVQRT